MHHVSLENTVCGRLLRIYMCFRNSLVTSESGQAEAGSAARNLNVDHEVAFPAEQAPPQAAAGSSHGCELRVFMSCTLPKCLSGCQADACSRFMSTQAVHGIICHTVDLCAKARHNKHTFCRVRQGPR